MQEILIGFVTLSAVLALKWGMDQWRHRRIARAWEDAQAELDRGNYEEGARHLAEFVRLMPLWLPARFLFGSVLAKQGRLDEAEAQFKMAQALQPRHAEGFVELGIFYITSANRIDEGVAALRQAIACEAAVLEQLRTDPRLTEFRESPAFAALQQP